MKQVTEEKKLLKLPRLDEHAMDEMISTISDKNKVYHADAINNQPEESNINHMKNKADYKTQLVKKEHVSRKSNDQRAPYQQSEQADEQSEQADEQSEQADEQSEQADEQSEQADEQSEQADEQSEQADEQSEQADEQVEEVGKQIERVVLTNNDTIQEEEEEEEEVSEEDITDPLLSQAP